MMLVFFCSTVVAIGADKTPEIPHFTHPWRLHLLETWMAPSYKPR